MPLGTPTLLAGATPAAAAAVTTAGFTPTPDALVVVVSVNVASAAANLLGSVSSTHSPALVWREGRVTGGGSTTGGVRYWWAWAPPGVGSGGVTVTLDGTPSIHDVDVFEVTGADPKGPIVGRESTTRGAQVDISASTTVTPTAADIVLGIVCNRNGSTAPTPGAGFTQLSAAAAASPSASMLIQHRTGTTDPAVAAGNVGTVWSGMEVAVVRADDGARTPRWRYTPRVRAGGRTRGVLLSYTTAGRIGTTALLGVPPSGGGPVSDTATLSGSGGLTVASPAAGAAALSGAGSLGASTSVAAAGTAALTGSGALSATAMPAALSAALLSGAGSLSATGSCGATGAAALTGSGALGATASATAPGSATLTGAGSLTATGSSGASGSAALTGTGALSATAATAVLGLAALTGSGSLGAISTPTVVAAGALTGSGTLAAAGTPRPTQAAALSGSGTLTAAGVSSGGGTPALTGSGSLTSGGRPNLAAPAALTGDGALTVTPRPGFARPVALTGDGTLAATTRPGYASTVALSGAGALSASTRPSPAVAALLAGGGTLNVSASLWVAAAVALTGDGQLSAVGVPVLPGAAKPGARPTLSLTAPSAQLVIDSPSTTPRLALDTTASALTLTHTEQEAIP